jgi:segregation and condensation protein A
MEEEQREVYYRKFFAADTKVQQTEDGEDLLKDVSLFNLIAAFKSAMDHMPRKIVHEVNLLNVSVDEQMSFVLDFLRVNGPTTLLELVYHMAEKVRVIVTIIALLELTKNKVVTLGAIAGKDDVSIRAATA